MLEPSDNWIPSTFQTSCLRICVGTVTGSYLAIREFRESSEDSDLMFLSALDEQQ